MTRVWTNRSRHFLTMALAATFVFGSVSLAAHAEERRDEHRDDRRGDRHAEERHDDRRREGYGGGYYNPPPVVYGSPCGYGGCAPPVVYGPGIGIMLPNVVIRVH